jgi:RHS repeat-associated protein
VSDSFAYDQADRLTGSTIGGSPSTTSSYAYNGDGLRASKTVGSATTRYVYDVARGLPRLLADYDGSGALLRKYVWGPSNLPGQGLAYNVTGGGAVEVYHVDHLGNIRELTDGTVGNAQLTTVYLTDEYGVVTTEQAPTGQQPSTQPFRFTGELYDKDAGTGFLYLRARVYDPNLGRFVQRDTLGGTPWAPASLNRYVYVANNPVNVTDPSGRDGPEILALATSGGAGATVLAAAALDLAAPVVLVGVGVAVIGYGGYQVYAHREEIGDTLGRAGAWLSAKHPGSRGGDAHQGTIERRIRELEAEGKEHIGGGSRKEEVIDTPTGEKSCRRPDITMQDPDTGDIHRENVGKSTKSGQPIARERRALDDIEAATGSRPCYTPYAR